MGGDFDDSFDDDALDDGGDSGDDGGDEEGGKSFAELKDEYEAGDADWADEMAEDGEEREDLTEELGDAGDVLEDPDGGADAATDETGGDLGGDELFDEVIEDDGLDDVDTDLEAGTEPEPATEPEPDPEPEPEPTADGSADTDDASTADGDATAESDADEAATGGNVAGEGKPYLAETPEGFAADVIVIEWLEFLVEEVGVRETARAIDYYERIDWVAEPVAEDLRAYLRGFDGEGGDGALTIDHHTRSLRYISQLEGGAAGALALSGLLSGGGSDGLQR
jgi:flagellar protein FlaE